MGKLEESAGKFRITGQEEEGNLQDIARRKK